MTHHRNMMQQVALGLVAAAAITAVGCDLSVTNPGPVADASLDSLNARRAVVTGARRALAEVVNATGPNDYGLAYRTAAIVYEINPAGSTGTFGVPTYIQAGTFHPDDNNWSDAHRARWIAEAGLRRFKARAFAADSLTTALNLWIGYANRLLGENFCDAVFDGGPKLDFKAYFARADSAFSEALRIANNLTIKAANKANMINAATAGRASVRMYQAYYTNDNARWAQALADANAVPTNNFVFSMPFYDQDQNQYNAVYWSRGNGPYRAHTEWGTFFENYFRTTKADTRVPWDTTTLLPTGTPATGDAAVAKFDSISRRLGLGGKVPFWPERKYNDRTAPVNLSTGWEMRLIEAEYELAVNNNPGNAFTKLNIRRGSLGLAKAGPGTLDSAWAALKEERGRELWLEARRMGDLRRWSASGTAGYQRGTPYTSSYATTASYSNDGVWIRNPTSGVFELRENMMSPVKRDMCIPIGLSEIQTNPNLRP